MENEIKIDKTARVIVEGRLMIDIEAVKKRFGGKMTKNGLSIPLEDIKDTVEIVNVIKPIYNFKAKG